MKKIIYLIAGIFLGLGFTAYAATVVSLGKNGTSEYLLYPTDSLSAANYISTSTTATNTFANGVNLTSGCFAIGSVCFTSSADGTYSTTSADYWKTQRDFFSTTSANYWETNQPRWATTSSDYWYATKGAWSTTSQAYWASLNTFATTSVDYWKTQRDFFSTTSVNWWYTLQSKASSTLLGDSNTWSGTNIFSNAASTFAGTAAKATILATARLINGVSFDGSGDITINAASSTLLANNNTFTGGNIFARSTTTNATATTLFATTASTSALYLGTGACSGGNALNLGTDGKVTCGTVTGSSGASTTLLGDNNLFSGANIFSNITRSTTTQATSTNFAVTTLCLIGDTCRTTWPTGGSGWPTSTNPLMATYFIATGTATSTFKTAIDIGNGTATTTISAAAGTSTPNGGVDLIAGGCFAINGTCMQSAAFSWMFTDATTYNTATQSTTSPMWMKLGVYASSTSYFDSITAQTATATTICFTGDICRTTWPTTASAASSTLLGDNNTFAGSNVFSNILRSTSTEATTTAFYATVASTSKLYGAGLQTCNSASNALTWLNGSFGCNSITATGGSGNVSTSTGETAGNLAYWTSTNGTPALLGSVATGTISNGTGISVTAGQSVIGSGLTITNTGVTALGGTGQQLTGSLILATSSTAFNGLTASTTITCATVTCTFANTLAGLLGIGGGGTGKTSFTNNTLHYGNFNEVATTTLTSGTGITVSAGAGALVGGVNATVGLATMNAGVLGSVTNGVAPTSQATSSLYLGSAGQVLSYLNGAWIGAATTTLSGSAPITAAYSAGNWAVGCTNASAGVTGCLTGTDYNTFAAKQSTISVTYPVTLSGATVGLAFGTTTNNNWSGLNVFQGASTTFVGNVSMGNATATNATTTGLLYVSGAGTSTVVGTLTVGRINETGAASSSFVNGINLSGGCFSIANTCVGGSSVLGADPTGTIGLSAVNGSASTYLRSDGAPALSQAIIPTWSQLHTFSAGFLATASSTLSGGVTISNSTTTNATSSIQYVSQKVSIASTSPWATFSINSVAQSTPIISVGSSTGEMLRLQGGATFWGVGTSTVFDANSIATFAKSSGTTTVNFGDIGGSGKTCFNTKNSAGTSISFYFVGTSMVVENNVCRP
jgi:hypothetical protein